MSATTGSRWVLPAILCAAVFFTACGGGSKQTSSVNVLPLSTLAQWTWWSGGITAGAGGSYGAMGVGSSSNVPGAREFGATWSARNGDLWMFGGDGLDSTGGGGLLNDLWRFSETTRNWTWMGGSNTVSAPGTYGTLGVAMAGNIPGARQNAVTWTDKNGNFWLFGGQGLDATGTVGLLNDLWMFDSSSGNWTWIGGSNATNSPTTSQMPGARQNAVGVTDSAGNFWLFGGQGVDANGTTGLLNDLWEFTPATSQWIWTGGNNTAGTYGTYGTLGVPSASNVPGAREFAVAWADAAGNFWLFGGHGYDSAVVLPTDPLPNVGLLNDLWEFNPKSKSWTWMNGSYLTNIKGSYGTMGTPAGSNFPGARSGAVAWTSSGTFWLFGGSFFNDLWQYDPTNNMWTWVGGSSSANAAGNYGTLGIADATNVPGGRLNAQHWTDSTGKFWIFGGNGYDSTGLIPQVPPVPVYPGLLNDLWVYYP